MSTERIITGVSISHERATVGQLEDASFSSQREAVASLLADERVSEAFALQTCNRVEAYVVTAEPGAGAEVLSAAFADVPADLLVELDHEGSLRHLLSVACGLESLVLGEDQILGQVRTAYQDARAVDGVGPLLEEAVTKAIHVGERARTETAINDGVVSLASAAVALAERETRLSDARAVVIGAGEMATIGARRLSPAVDSLVIANRTVTRADHLAASLDRPAEAIGLDEFPAAVPEADIVLAATGAPEPVVGPDAFADAGETLVVDIAQPRDVPVAAGDVPGVHRYDIDDLEAVTEETRASRRAAAEAVERIVDAELDHLLKRYKRKRADSAISAMYEGAERIKARELETALGKLDLSEAEAAVVEDMADAIVYQLLAAPTNSLRDAAERDDWSTIHAALRLFDPPERGEGAAVSDDLADADAAPEDADESTAAVGDRSSD